MSADIPTMLLMIIVTSTVMAGSVLTVAWGQSAPGLARWAAALLVQALAYVLLALRGKVPDAYSVVLGNVLLSVSFAVMLAAVCRFQGRGASHWLLWPPVLLALAISTLRIDDLQARMVYGSALLAAQAIVVVAALLDRRHGSVGRGAVLVIGALVLAASMLILRAASTAAGWVAIDSLQDRNMLQTISFMTSLAAAQATSIGFVFMTKERADETNRIMATQDALTGIANRRTIIGALERDMLRALRNRQPLSLLMIDIDHFKTINDVYGHLAGDRVLCAVVDAIRERVRAQDLIGRYGGEEFMVLLPETALDGGRQVAEKLRQGIADTPCLIDGQPVSVTVSIGLYGGYVLAEDSWDHLIHEADRALYRAKEQGRNRFEIAAGPQEPGPVRISGFAELAQRKAA